MFKYWVKNRLLFDIFTSIILIIISAFAFIAPMFANIGEARLMASLYESDKLDFDVPSPSYEQIALLEKESSIESVFPYFFTNTSVSVNGKTRDTNIFFSDAFNKLDQTMYCDSRLIEKASGNYSNPILVDYQFVLDTGVKLGSVISATFGVIKVEFQVSAIYETNTYYEGGAVLAKWEGAQKDAIMAVSPKLEYSGAYIQAADYQLCKQYLESQYKPYGRLKDREDFATQEAYDIHYNAFMSANYANEITDFAAKGQESVASAEVKLNNANLFVVFAFVLIAVLLIVYNLGMWLRKSERVYFAKRKVSGDSKTVAYYLISTLVQAALVIFGIVASVFVVPAVLSLYIPASAIISKAIVFIIATACIMIVVVVENMVLVNKTKK